MASLRKVHQQYYARITWREGYKKCEKPIPLNTNLKSEALIRKTEVESYEDDIKNGEDYTPLFGWLNENGGKTKIVRRSVQEAIDEYLAVKNLRQHRKSTIDRARVGLQSLTDVVGKTQPVSILNDKDIDKWFEKCNEKGHSPNTLACNRAKIVSFLNHSYRKEWIKKEIYFPSIENTKKEIKCVNEDLFKNIMALDSLDEHFKRSFFFYISTGCRRAEPFKGDIIGSQLRITCDTSKSKTTDLKSKSNTRFRAAITTTTRLKPMLNIEFP